ncbi:30S ribosomal protein S6 modification protein [Vibrio viridaestus]|uniref:30S ribosomal protein S6 modification protein n=1 Tax=Vibrio viridaestus TaxID=2487322 RepID=A0A3N9THV3_9VIBR|nr:30S ribosomal protein S6 modification protein [Vibrio viridaestus]RQW63463.1 30S ribosomal protein S6 modification protein [Vibrio viridaestus]
METHSKILVWYRVATQRIVLGEARFTENNTLTSLWVNTPSILGNLGDPGFGISLIGDDGREIADKAISMLTADTLLIDNAEAGLVP